MELSDRSSGATLDLTLRPNRSLGLRGFKRLVASVAAVGFAVGMSFVALGAWPVFGFFGLNVLLLYLAFRLNYRSGRLCERIELTHDTLRVWRTEPNGRQQRWEFQSYWARVLMDDPPTESSPLVLASHGRRLTIGAFLSPDERLKLARALRRAIGKLRAGPAERAQSERPES